MRNNEPKTDEPRFDGAVFACLFGTLMSDLAHLASALHRGPVAGDVALDRIVKAVLASAGPLGSQEATTPDRARQIMATGLRAMADAMVAERVV
jgi:hypothetical protein